MKKLFKHLWKSAVLIGIYTFMYLVIERGLGEAQIRKIRERSAR